VQFRTACISLASTSETTTSFCVDFLAAVWVVLSVWAPLGFLCHFPLGFSPGFSTPFAPLGHHSPTGSQNTNKSFSLPGKSIFKIDAVSAFRWKIEFSFSFSFRSGPVVCRNAWCWCLGCVNLNLMRLRYLNKLLHAFCLTFCYFRRWLVELAAPGKMSPAVGSFLGLSISKWSHFCAPDLADKFLL